MDSNFNIGRIITISNNGVCEILCIKGEPLGDIITFESLDITNIRVDDVVSFVFRGGNIVAIAPIMVELKEPEQEE